jgi:hypothetical protein
MILKIMSKDQQIIDLLSAQNVPAQNLKPGTWHEFALLEGRIVDNELKNTVIN